MRTSVLALALLSSAASAADPITIVVKQSRPRPLTKLLRFLTPTQPVQECGASALTTDTTSAGAGLNATTLSYTGASTHTCTRSDGTPLQLASGQPRVDCQGCTVVTAVNGATPAQILGGKLLAEAGATNYVPTSIRLDQSTNTVPTRITITADQYTAPDGTLTGDKLVENSLGASNAQGVYWIVTVPSGTKFVNSAWVRGDTSSDKMSFGVNCLTGSAPTCSCARDDGGSCSVFSSGTFCYTYATWGTAWVHAQIRATCTAAVTSIAPFWGGGQFQASVAGTGGYWGLDFEAGAVATSYIPTTGTSATRAADALSAGAVSLSTTPSLSASVTLLALPVSSADVLQAYSSSTDNWTLSVRSTGAVRCAYGATTVDSTALVTAGTAARVACYYDGARLGACAGSTCTTSATALTPATSFSGVYFGSDNAGATQLGGRFADGCLASTAAGCR